MKVVVEAGPHLRPPTSRRSTGRASFVLCYSRGATFVYISGRAEPGTRVNTGAHTGSSGRPCGPVVPLQPLQVPGDTCRT